MWINIIWMDVHIWVLCVLDCVALAHPKVRPSDAALGSMGCSKSRRSPDESNVEDRHRRRRGRSLAFGQRLLFALHENVVERIVADRLRQALDPHQFVLLGGRRHSVDGVLALHHLRAAGNGMRECR